jgi:hypothetical protein
MIVTRVDHGAKKDPKKDPNVPPTRRTPRGRAWQLVPRGVFLVWRAVQRSCPACRGIDRGQNHPPGGLGQLRPGGENAGKVGVRPQDSGKMRALIGRNWRWAWGCVVRSAAF